MRNEYEVRGDVTSIFINRRGGEMVETLVSTTDLPRLLEFDATWCLRVSPAGKMYVHTNPTQRNGLTKTTTLHNWLLNPPSGYVADHKDGNGLKNTRDNLRTLTQAQNNQNITTTRGKNPYRGVHLSHGKWQAKVKHNGKVHHVGTFTDLNTAIEEVKKARREILPFSVE
jgi:hypothetical protein